MRCRDIEKVVFSMVSFRSDRERGVDKGSVKERSIELLGSTWSEAKK